MVIGNALTNNTVDGDTLTVTLQTSVTGSNGGMYSIDATRDKTFSHRW